MSTAGHTPNFVAEENIYPFRCVMVGSAPFKAVTASSDPEILLGVTDGSVQGFNSVYNASAGQLISMQNGEFVQLTAGGSISVGDTLIASTDGKVVASTTATEYIAQAAEGANDGEVFWAKKIGAWTVHGGGGGGGGTLTVDVQEFDDPEEVNTWVKPAGAMRVYVQLCGAGQDGTTGPYAGNGGTVADKWMNASDLPSTVAVTIGVHQPFATASDDGTSSFGTYVSAGIAGASGPSPADAGGSTIEICGFNMAGWYRYGQGDNDDFSMIEGGAHGFSFGPGGGGRGGVDSAPTAKSGGKPSTNRTVEQSGQMRVAFGGGGAAGTTGAQGGNGGNGSIDPVTGFGGGGGGGGFSTTLGNAGGNGGNGIRGGGGGGAGVGGTWPTTYPGLPGSGGDGYVRVSTLCYA